MSLSSFKARLRCRKGKLSKFINLFRTPIDTVGAGFETLLVPEADCSVMSSFVPPSLFLPISQSTLEPLERNDSYLKSVGSPVAVKKSHRKVRFAPSVVFNDSMELLGNVQESVEENVKENVQEVEDEFPIPLYTPPDTGDEPVFVDKRPPLKNIDFRTYKDPEPTEENPFYVLFPPDERRPDPVDYYPAPLWGAPERPDLPDPIKRVNGECVIVSDDEPDTSVCSAIKINNLIVEADPAYWNKLKKIKHLSTGPVPTSLGPIPDFAFKTPEEMSDDEEPVERPRSSGIRNRPDYLIQCEELSHIRRRKVKKDRPDPRLRFHFYIEQLEAEQLAAEKLAAEKLAAEQLAAEGKVIEEPEPELVEEIPLTEEDLNPLSYKNVFKNKFVDTDPVQRNPLKRQLYELTTVVPVNLRRMPIIKPPGKSSVSGTSLYSVKSFGKPVKVHQIPAYTVAPRPATSHGAFPDYPDPSRIKLMSCGHPEKLCKCSPKSGATSSSEIGGGASPETVATSLESSSFRKSTLKRLSSARSKMSTKLKARFSGKKTPDSELVEQDSADKKKSLFSRKNVGAEQDSEVRSRRMKFKNTFKNVFGARNKKEECA